MRKFIVANDLLDRERQRMEIRKQLGTARGIVAGVVGGTLCASGVMGAGYRHFVVAHFTWSRFAIYSSGVVFSLLLLFSIIDRVFRKVEDYRLTEWAEQHDA